MFGQLLPASLAPSFSDCVVSVYDPEIPAGWSGIFIASQDAYAKSQPCTAVLKSQ